MRIELSQFNEYVGGNRLRCEVRDLNEFFYASMESAHASTVYCVACLSFTLALVTTTQNIILAVIPMDARVNPARWLQLLVPAIQDSSALASSFASFVALEYFVKLFLHQRKVVRTVRGFSTGISNETVVKLGRIARFQSYVSFLSSIGALGAVCVLMFGLVDRRVEAFDLSNYVDIVVVATGVFGVWFLAGLGTFYIDFFLLWNFGPTAGKDVCRQFRTKITDIYNKYAESIDDEHLIKDYTVREFLAKSRFDSVVGANRFSAIMHAILSDEELTKGPMKRRELPEA